MASILFKQFHGADIAVALFLSLIIKVNLTNSSYWTTCEASESLVCNCTSNILANVTARCHFTHVTDLGMIIKSPLEIFRLNLTGNNIKEILPKSFYNYSRLIYLSLAFNKIHIISGGAFNGLAKLRELNLQDNMIKQWDTTLIDQDLPNLIMLNVAQNIYWKPDQRILSLKNLKIIYLLLALYPQNLFRCHLVRGHTNSTFVEQIPRSLQENVEPEFIAKKISSSCYYNKLTFHNSNYWVIIHKNGFYFHCETVLPKYIRKRHLRRLTNVTEPPQQNGWFYLRVTLKPYCWDIMNSILLVGLVEGIFATLMNVIVIITTLRSRVLQESVAHVLVANIAVADLITSSYMIIITSTRQNMSAENYFSIYLPYYCRIVGVFFLIGQFSSPMMSYIMTLERYLAVVYCMRPHIRITGRMACVVMVIAWSLSLSLAVSFMTSKQLSTKTDSMCVPYPNIHNQQMLNYIGGTGVVLYIIAIALYAHMYVDFQKTNQKTVQLQRENRLACKIALIIFTNVLFFILPLIVIAAVNVFQDRISHATLYIFWKTFAITFLGLNPCINPILFSLRNEQFRSEFIKKFCHLRRPVAPQP